MRGVSAIVVAITGGIAHADSWSEYGTSTRLRPAAQLVETACDLEVTLTGAIVEVEQRERLWNPGAEELAAVGELTLPAQARLVGLELQRGTTRAESALAVRTPIAAERVSSTAVLGADPAIATAIDTVAERSRYRVIVQPIASEHEVTVTTRWTQAAAIRAGALHVVLPARAGKPCRGVVHATPGPGTMIARVRIAGQEVAARSFTLGATNLTIAVELAFKRDEPVVWRQRQQLAADLTAEAITVLTPPKKLATQRALFVIDSSRSMELVGRHNVKQLVRGIAATLPQGTQLEAILYDRTPKRVFGEWRTSDATQLAAIEQAYAARASANGTDPVAALALARQTILDARGHAIIVLITDGAFGELGDNALGRIISAQQGEIDLHAIVLTAGRMNKPDSEELRRAIDRVGGSYTEITAAAVDVALAGLDEWLRPAYLELALDKRNDVIIPDQLPAGGGVVAFAITREKTAKLVLTGRTDKPLRAAAQPAAAAAIAELALEHASAGAGLDATRLAELRLRHASVNADHALIVTTSEGKVAKNRRQVAAEGGPFTRMVAVDDPAFAPIQRIAQASPGGSAIDRQALELLFRTQLQPAAFTCYQRALVRRPQLAGTVQFQLEIGRGETLRAKVAGLGEPTLDACLLDAAYKVTPALPNPDYNVDDLTVANYPLTFTVKEHKPYVVPGDADSAEPLDISSIRGGVPVKIKAGDTTTPLGDLEVAPSP